ncbi:MAG: hypothetical protein MOB07_19990 [Acidobacteria bacterium]|nr:hypothetical protein [Acidobacteriota bacterium]
MSCNDLKLVGWQKLRSCQPGQQRSKHQRAGREAVTGSESLLQAARKRLELWDNGMPVQNYDGCVAATTLDE